MNNKLLDTYKAVLATAKLSVSTDGYVSTELMGEKQPFLISGKRLVIPTDEQLRNPDRESRIIFHPLKENPLQPGESEVLSAFRGSLNTRLNGSVALLLANLVRLASSVAEHKKLNPDQSEYLSLIKDADEKTFDALAKIIAAMPLGQTKKAFISIYLKKGAQFGEKKFKKGAVVSFPICKEMAEKKDEVYGVKVRQKDIKAFRALMEYVFPNCLVPDVYSFGSNSNVAPSLEAVMGAVKLIGERINEICDNFKGIIEDIDEILINHHWVEVFDDIESLLPLISRIPTQLGNEGRLPLEQAIKERDAEETKPGLIPVKEKLSFAALPQAAPAIGNFANQGRGLGLSEAMRGMNSAFGFQQNAFQPVQPAANTFGFAALGNRPVSPNPFNVGMGNVGTPFGFATTSRI